MVETKQIDRTAIPTVLRAFCARVSSSVRRSVHRGAGAFAIATLICVACSNDSGPQLPPPGSATLQPSDTVVYIGQKLQLAIVVRDHLGQLVTVPSTVTWRSSNDSVARVSASGLVTGVAIGTARMTASCCGASATATITVQPVEPTDATLITERSFVNLNENGWHDDETRTGMLTIVQDTTAPKSPLSVGQIRYPTGFVAGSAPSDNNSPGFAFAPRTLYLSYWAKYSANFFGQSADNKQVYMWDNLPRASVYTSARGAGNGNLVLSVITQSSTDNNAYAPNRNISRASFTRDVWHRVEVVLVGNTSGASDGSIDFWLDGEPIGHYTGIRFAAGAETWGRVEWAPNWGGAGGTVPFDMFMWMDHLRVSGR